MLLLCLGATGSHRALHDAAELLGLFKEAGTAKLVPLVGLCQGRHGLPLTCKWEMDKHWICVWPTVLWQSWLLLKALQASIPGALQGTLALLDAYE